VIEIIQLRAVACFLAISADGADETSERPGFNWQLTQKVVDPVDPWNSNPGRQILAHEKKKNFDF
jgi:hypothetical protein